MQYISIILFAFIAVIKAFLDTIIFRSGKSIFPESWNPFNSYSKTPLFLGLIRLDVYHKTMYVFIFLIIGSIMTYKPLFCLYDIALFGLIWGVFFEGSWRLFKK